MPQENVKPSQLHTPPSVLAGILLVSAAASALILWLVYAHAPSDAAGTQLHWLPLVNAALNSLSAIALITGYVEIRERRVLHHRASMVFAFLFSAIFLICYLVNLRLHGETRLPIAHHGALWDTYAGVLITHIPLAIVALPMILITFFLSLTGRFPSHRRIARWTFPVWLYVSVSGVFVYFLQAVIHK